MATITYNSCGRQNVDCHLPLRGFNDTPPSPYPLSVFDFFGILIPGPDANNAKEYVDIWNSSSNNQILGTLELGPDDYTFGLRIADWSFANGITYVTGARWWEVNITNNLNRILVGKNCRYKVGNGTMQYVTNTGTLQSNKPLFTIPQLAYSARPDVYRVNTLGVGSGNTTTLRVWYTSVDNNLVSIWGNGCFVNSISGSFPAGLKSLELFFQGQPGFSISSLSGSQVMLSNLETLSINNYGWAVADTFRYHHLQLPDYSTKLQCFYSVGYQEQTNLLERANYPNLHYLFRNFNYGSYFPAPTYPFPDINELPRLEYGINLQLNYQNIDTYRGGQGCDFIYNSLADQIDYGPAFPGAAISVADSGYQTATAASLSARNYLAGLGWII